MNICTHCFKSALHTYCKKLINLNNEKNNIISSVLKYNIFLIIFIFCFSNAYTQTAGGGYSESYLLRNIGARATSMAGAFTAIANDPTCLFYNPSGLSSLSDKPAFTTTYSFLEFGRTHSALAWGQSISQNFGLGLAVNNFTTGSFVARDVRGNPIGNFTDWQFSLNGGASYSIENASFGLGFKYLSNALIGSGDHANGFGIDIGTKFNIMDLFTAGICVQNIGGIMFWNSNQNVSANEVKDFLPYTVRAGIAMQFSSNEQTYSTRSTVTGELEEVNAPATEYVLLSIEGISVQHDNAPNVVLGIEAAPHEVVAFRGGIALAGDVLNKYKLFPMTVWGAGVSIRPRKQDIDLPFRTYIDYSVASDQLASNKISHHLSLSFEF
jgi:hypothetical protein